jgi:hypothetical protein
MVVLTTRHGNLEVNLEKYLTDEVNSRASSKQLGFLHAYTMSISENSFLVRKARLFLYNIIVFSKFSRPKSNTV